MNVNNDANNTNQMLSDKMLDVIKSIASESMQQEKDRAELIKSKSERLVKYISATIGCTNTIVVFLLDREVIELKSLYWIAVYTELPLLVSLILAVLAQIMLKGLYYPSGISALKDLAYDGREKSLLEFKIYKFKCMEDYTNSLSLANNKRANAIKWSYFFYLLCIGLSIGYVIVTLFKLN